MRAVAVLAVVLFHAGGMLPGGFVGVDVFFVISGFVICRLLWHELETKQKLSFGGFYRRRVRRLLPALCGVLVFVALGSLAVQNPMGMQQDTSLVGIASTLFSGNVALMLTTSGDYFALPSTTQPLLHMWTLAVEEQFYVGLPITLLILFKVARGRRQLVATGIVVCACVSFVLGYVTTYGLTSFGDSIPGFAFYGSPTRAWEFLAGCLLALIEPSLRRVPARVATASGLLGALGLGLAFALFDEMVPFPGLGALLPVAATVLLIVAGTSSSGGVVRLLCLKPMIWIGDLSYGWYLWHWPFIVYARLLSPSISDLGLAAIAVASLAPTWLSYRFIENPIRFHPNLGGRRVVFVAVVCCALPLMCFGALRVWATHPTGEIADAVDQGRPHLGREIGCVSLLPSQMAPGKCEWEVPDAKGTIYLVGDSHSGHFLEPVLAASKAEGYNLVHASYGGCLFGDLQRAGAQADDPACSEFVDEWRDYIGTHPASLVIIANESTDPIGAPYMVMQVPGEPKLYRTSAEKSAVWERELRVTLEAVSAGGNPVAVIGTTPRFSSNGLEACPTVWLLESPNRCSESHTLAWEVSRAEPARSAERKAVAAVPGAFTTDFFDELCDVDTCSMRRAGRWLYRDSSHLTVEASLTLTDPFRDLIRKHARTISSG